MTWHSRASVVVVSCLIGISSAAEAKPRQGFKCGYVQRIHFGLPAKFNLALNWATLPHTSARPGAVVVQRRKGRALGGGPGGHVSRIVNVTGQCRAIVTDNRGTYERDICKNLVAYVQP